MRKEELFIFIRERHNIWLKRNAGAPKPWTNDKILQQYRFCNVYRELDKVTLWIAKHWRTPHAKDPDLWFAMTVARFFNLPDTLKDIGYPVPFKPKKMLAALITRRAFGENLFNGAYMVRSDKMPKEQYVVERVLTPMWEDRVDIQRTILQGGLAEVHRKLMGFYGMGSFMAAQVVADLKYVKPLLGAPDWHTWAASGPGSKRGLARVFGIPIEKKTINYARRPETRQVASMREEDFFVRLQELHVEINKLVKRYKLPEIHAQDLQNCLCEFDKYERARLGEGRPKAHYAGV